MNSTKAAYPGPVPLEAKKHAGLLYGRNADTEILLNATMGRKVVEVTAPSGTGKSSLLMAGLRPDLQKRGFTVAVLRSWADVSGTDAGSYYQAAVRRAFVESEIDPDREWTGDLITDFEALAADYGSDLVLLFDQLEELLRLDPLLGRQFIETTVIVAEDWPFRQVLSLRSEYKEELNVLEEKLSRLKWTHRSIRPIEPQYEPMVVQGPSAAAGWSFTPEATDSIVEVWREARASTFNVGLLHLQAMLWVIERQLAPTPGQVVDRQMLTTPGTLLADVLGPVDGEKARGAQVAAEALQRYADLRIGQLTDEQEDRWVGRECRYTIARLAGELSSSGYKISRGTVELFFRAFDGIENLQWDRRVVTTLLAAVSDWSLQSNTVSTPTAAKVLEIALDKGVTPESLGGNADLLSGRLAGFEALPGLAELIVVFERSLSWLDQASIVRITKDLQGRRFVTLVHDGYGSAMNRWAREVLGEPQRFLEAPVGSNGSVVLPGALVETTDGPELRGLRWPGCILPHSTFRGVRFVDCDLRGAIFSGCEFEDVVFEKCRMPGTLFLGGRIHGAGCVIQSCETQTLTVRGVSLDGSGLVVRNTSSYGLFLDDVDGGPWSIEQSAFRHLSVIGGEGGIGPGYITDSTLAHVYLTGESAPTVVHHSTLHYVDTSAGTTSAEPDAAGCASHQVSG